MATAIKIFIYFKGRLKLRKCRIPRLNSANATTPIAITGYII